MKNNRIWVNCPSKNNENEEISPFFSFNPVQFNPKVVKVDQIVSKIQESQENEKRNVIFSVSKNDSGYEGGRRMDENKTRGRRKKADSREMHSEHGRHSKFHQDNIKRKIKTHFHNFLVAYLNQQIKKEWEGTQKYKFRKMESSITQDITIPRNKKLLEEPLRNILSSVSKKFNDRTTNGNFIGKISRSKPNLSKLLDKTYKEMYEELYLTSTEETFEDKTKDESFTTHLKKIREKDGYEYMKKYEENAKKFVNFFLCCKERKRKRTGNQGDQASSQNEEKSEKKEETFENTLELQKKGSGISQVKTQCPESNSGNGNDPSLAIQTPETLKNTLIPKAELLVGNINLNYQLVNCLDPFGYFFYNRFYQTNNFLQ